MTNQTMTLRREVAVNIGNFESVRITVELTGVPKENYEEANREIKARILAEVSEITDINGLPRSAYRYTGD